MSTDPRARIAAIGLSLVMLAQAALGAEGASAEPWLVELNRRNASAPVTSADKPVPKASGAYGKSQVGPDIAGYLDHDAVILDSPELAAYLQQVAGKLLAQWQGPRPELKFLLRSTVESCAYSDVNRVIVICTGYLRTLENEDQLAALLGHEISHVLLAHGKDAEMRQKAPLGIGLAESLAEGIRQQQAGGTVPLSSRSGDALGTAELATTLWSDMLAPSWNRDQEREADRLGLDLMKAAGYNDSAFAPVLEQLDHVRAGRSERLQAVQQAAGKELALQRSQRTQPDSLNAVGAQVGQEAAQGALDAILDSVSESSQTYDPPAERLRLLQDYSAAVYPKRRDKTQHVEGFVKQVKEGPVAQLLQVDAQAVEIRHALQTGDLRSALVAADSVPADASSGILSMDLARSGAYLAVRQPVRAIPLLESATSSSLAPASAYRNLAQAYRAERRYQDSLATLSSGAGRIGREQGFLPDMVESARLAQASDAAESYTLRCADQPSLSSVQGSLVAFASGQKDTAVATPQSPLYRECVRRLGYDPIKRREAQAQQQRNSASNGVKSLMDSIRKSVD